MSQFAYAASQLNLKHLLRSIWLQQTTPNHILDASKVTIKVWNSVADLSQGPSKQAFHFLPLRSLHPLIQDISLTDWERSGIKTLAQLFSNKGLNAFQELTAKYWNSTPYLSIYKYDIHCKILLLNKLNINVSPFYTQFINNASPQKKLLPCSTGNAPYTFYPPFNSGALPRDSLSNTLNVCHTGNHPPKFCTIGTTPLKSWLLFTQTTPQIAGEIVDTRAPL